MHSSELDRSVAFEWVPALHGNAAEAPSGQNDPKSHFRLLLVEVKQPALLFLFRLTLLLQLAVLSLQITQRKVELQERCTRLVLSQLVIRLLPVVIRST